MRPQLCQDPLRQQEEYLTRRRTTAFVSKQIPFLQERRSIGERDKRFRIRVSKLFGQRDCAPPSFPNAIGGFQVTTRSIPSARETTTMIGPRPQSEPNASAWTAPRWVEVSPHRLNPVRQQTLTRRPPQPPLTAGCLAALVVERASPGAGRAARAMQPRHLRQPLPRGRDEGRKRRRPHRRIPMVSLRRRRLGPAAQQWPWALRTTARGPATARPPPSLPLRPLRTPPRPSQPRGSLELPPRLAAAEAAQ